VSSIATASGKVLVVDDTPTNVKLLADVLRIRGYTVTTATNGEDALSSIATDRPDLVLLDVMMPQASGYEVCQTIRLRPEWRHIRIIMLSAKGRDSEVVKGFAMGADAYVTKPFSTRDLVDRIEALLEPRAPSDPPKA